MSKGYTSDFAKIANSVLTTLRHPSPPEISTLLSSLIEGWKETIRDKHPTAKSLRDYSGTTATAAIALVLEKTLEDAGKKPPTGVSRYFTSDPAASGLILAVGLLLLAHEMLIVADSMDAAEADKKEEEEGKEKGP